MQLIEENDSFEGEVDDLLFLSLSGRMLNNNNVLRDFKKYAIEAGITKRFYIHLLRHSAATHYLSSSGDVESLRLILGHADSGGGNYSLVGEQIEEIYNLLTE